MQKTYEEDKEKFMKRKAKYIYEIKKDCIDCNAIICRWQSIIIEDQYHLFSKNCATVVMDVLIAGALCERYRQRSYRVCTPADLKNIAKKKRAILFYYGENGTE